ncbi:MAG: tyrosine-type recombinase/integrase [Acidimicrobiia bacterium]
MYFDTTRERWIGQADAGINPKTGKRRRVKVTGRDGEGKAAVARRLKEKIAELEITSATAPETVGELVETWMRRSAPKTKSESTMEMVRSLVGNHVLPVFGGARLSAITVEDIEEFLDARADTHSKSTLVKLRAILSQAFDFGVRRRHMTWNPAKIAELPPEADQTREGRALSSSEARALLNVAGEHRLGAWITTAVTLGLRPGEISGLTWEAVDLEAGTLTVFQALSWPGGKPTLKGTKTGNTRTLALPPITADALAAHRKVLNEERLLMGRRWPAKWSSLVFVSENGTPIDPANIRRIVRSLAEEADIEGPVTPYDLRHTATTLIAGAGLSADRLADLLGHKDTRMVFQHYRHRDALTVTTAADYWQSNEGVSNA